MKQLVLRLERGAMFLLVLMPMNAFIMRLLIAPALLGPALLAVQTLCVCMLALMPAYVGNYTETEVIVYDGGLNQSSLNPDRESHREIIKQGHRFPLRLSTDILFIIITLLCLTLLPKHSFVKPTGMYKIIFIGLMIVLEFSSMFTIAGSYCFWTELPGILLGFVQYLAIAFYLRFSKADTAALGMFIGPCAIAYVFMGGIFLNRQSLNINSGTGVDAAKRKAPRQVVRRNRAIVIGFAAFAAVTSFIGPIRQGALWLWAQFVKLLKWIAWLLRGGQEVSEGNLEKLMEMQTGGTRDIAEVETELEEIGGLSVWDKIFLYGFFGLVALGLVWIIVSWLVKLSKKLSQLLEKFAHNVNEGYYDEKEDLMDAKEARRRLRDELSKRLKGLFTRPTPWEKLSGRERARRLVQTLYAKRGRKITGLRALTAREALSRMNLKSSAAEHAGEAYDRARYSPHEVDASQMDALKKEIRP